MGNGGNQYEEYITQASKKYGVDANLIKGVIQTESNYNPYALSKAGAKGLMQLMPNTWKAYGVSNPYNAKENIMAGTAYLADMLEWANGDTEKALAAYNAGQGNVSKNGKEKYADYYNKVLTNAHLSADASVYNPDAVGVNTGTKWWGDIVVVVFCILVIIFGVLFAFGAFGNSVSGTVNKIKKKVVG